MGCFVSILHTKEILSFSVSLQGSSFLGHLGDTSASPPIRKVIGIRSQTLYTTQITIQNHITAYHNKFAEMSKLPLNKQKRELDKLYAILVSYTISIQYLRINNMMVNWSVSWFSVFLLPLILISPLIFLEQTSESGPSISQFALLLLLLTKLFFINAGMVFQSK